MCKNDWQGGGAGGGGEWRGGGMGGANTCIDDWLTDWLTDGPTPQLQERMREHSVHAWNMKE